MDLNKKEPTSHLSTIKLILLIERARIRILICMHAGSGQHKPNADPETCDMQRKI
jgi:hypothetical protein